MSLIFQKLLQQEENLSYKQFESKERYDYIKKIHNTVSRLSLNHHIRSSAVEIFDQFISHTSSEDRIDYNLYPEICVGIAASFISCVYKHNEIFRYDMKLKRYYKNFEKEIAEVLFLKIPVCTTSNFLEILSEMFSINFHIDEKLKEIELKGNPFLPSITAVALAYESLHISLKSAYISYVNSITSYTLADIEKFTEYFAGTLFKVPEHLTRTFFTQLHISGEIISGDEYIKKENIGEGTFANVYEVCEMCEDGENEESFALKKFNPETYICASNYKEISYLTILKHPNILGYDLIVKFTDSYGIITELLDHDLSILIHQMEDLTDNEKLDIIDQFLRAVNYLHSIGIVHSDIKMENVMMIDGTMKLIDFGLSSYYTYSKINQMSSVGTAVNQSIEFLMGKRNYSFPFDCWACGCVIYEIMREDHPFDPFDNRVRSIDTLIRRILKMTGTQQLSTLSDTAQYQKYSECSFIGFNMSKCTKTKNISINTIMRGFFTLDEMSRLTIPAALAVLSY